MSIKSKRLLQGDPVIWVVFFLLCMISAVEVFSAGSTLAYKSGDYLAPLRRQAAFLVVGTGVAWAVHCIPCRYFRLGAVVLYPFSAILLIITLALGGATNDGARWINIGFSFQPSELAKGALVMMVAHMLSYSQTAEGTAPKIFKPIMIITGFMCLLIVTENLSTAALLFLTICVMLFIARVPYRQLLRLMGFFAAVGAVVVLTVSIVPTEKLESFGPLHRVSVWVTRITSHASSAEERKDTVAYLRDHAQEAHANIAIATSNVVGKMPGNSEQRDRLAQAYSDFIYAIIIEEMGVWGAIGVAFLYIVLLFRAGRIASRCERNFPAFLIMGLAVLLVTQAMINMLVAVGLFPVTGQPLPLVSRGGTSTIITCVYFGMMLSISRYARRKPEEPAPRALPSGTEAPAEDPEEAEAEKEFVSNEGMQ